MLEDYQAHLHHYHKRSSPGMTLTQPHYKRRAMNTATFNAADGDDRTFREQTPNVESAARATFADQCQQFRLDFSWLCLLEYMMGQGA